MLVEILTHGIKVHKFHEDELPHLRDFCRPLVEMTLVKEGRRFKQVPARTYASATKNRKEFWFHANQKNELLAYLSRCGIDFRVKERPVDLSKVFRCDFLVKAMHELRDYQDDICNNYILKDGLDGPGRTRMVTMAPGRGKTLCAMYSMARLGVRTVVMLKGGFVERWVGDLGETFDFEDDELVVVRGTPGLIKVMKLQLEGELNAKVLIVTNKTYYQYLKDHEASNGRSKKYPIKPEDFFPAMGIGFRVMDEVHMEFHHNYRVDLYTHVPLALSLSATMVSSDRFKNRVYDIAYPVMNRHDGGTVKPHVTAMALHYRFKDPEKIRWKGPMGGYSHHTFEQWLRRSKTMTKLYFKMINWAIHQRYYSYHEKGQKLLVFCASVEMCTMLTEYLADMYPTLDVVRYTQEDDYDDLLDADIAVSTVMSAGTAVDIPNLRTVIMTTAVDSRQSNEQALGRPRPLKGWPDVTPEFVYMVCDDIDKHVDYHNNKRQFFKGRVINHHDIEAPFSI